MSGENSKTGILLYELLQSVIGMGGKGNAEGIQEAYASGFLETEILAYHPEAVVYDNCLYLFYIPLKEDGLYYTYRKNGKWMPGKPVRTESGQIPAKTGGISEPHVI